MGSPRSLKSLLSAPLAALLRSTRAPRKAWLRLLSFSRLQAALSLPLPSTVVVEGPCTVHGTGRIAFGEHCLLYADLHLETREAATIHVGNGCVFSRGVHLVAMAGITLGDGCMIGEYTSLRDSNHRRVPGVPLRDAGHTSAAIHLGKEVWLGRGVTVLPGVTIGDFATVGANAVVTRDVPAFAVVAGVPAKPVAQRSMQATADA